MGDRWSFALVLFLIVLRVIHLLAKFTHLQKTALQTGGEKVRASLGGAEKGAYDKVHAVALRHVTTTVAVRDDRAVADENVRSCEELTGGEAEVDEFFVRLFSKECWYFAIWAFRQFT